MTESTQWILFLAIGIGTFAIRFSFIGLHGRFRLPPSIQQGLAYVPSSMLAALVLPAILVPDSDHQFTLLNPLIPSALVAGLVSWKTNNILFTLVAGMGCLWLLQIVT